MFVGSFFEFAWIIDGTSVQARVFRIGMNFCKQLKLEWRFNRKPIYISWILKTYFLGTLSLNGLSPQKNYFRLFSMVLTTLHRIA